MNAKNWFPWFCIVALLVSEIFLFSANRQRNVARADALNARTQIEQLRSDLEQARASGGQASDSEIARLRSENQDLVRLRTQVRQLSETNRLLTQQLQTARATAPQQQTQLQQQQAQVQQLEEQVQQLQTEKTQAETSSAAPPGPATAADAQRACINNLRLIDAAKQQWALENNKTAADVPTARDLLPYIAAGFFPFCPAGGTYNINAVGELPTCSIPGHALPQ